MQLFTNNASTALSSDIGTGTTTITVDDGSALSTPTGGDFQLLTLTDGVLYEIVSMTARTGNSLTITRAQEGTTAIAWSATAIVSSRVTKGTLEAFLTNLSTESLAFAVGDGATAVASGTAVGNGATASGSNATAVGRDAVASGTLSIAVKATASADYTYAAGSNSVASNTNAVAIGRNTLADGTDTVAIGGATSSSQGARARDSRAVAVGTISNASAANTVAVGGFSTASATGAAALGYFTTASAINAIAMGFGSTAAVAGTLQIAAVPIGRKDTGSITDPFRELSVAQVALGTVELDLTAAAADDVATITVPAGSHFFPDEVQIIITASDTVTGDPSVAVGTTAGGGELRASAAVTETNQFERNIATAVSRHGITGAINISLKTAATATTLTGRVLITGILVEDE